MRGASATGASLRTTGKHTCPRGATRQRWGHPVQNNTFSTMHHPLVVAPGRRLLCVVVGGAPDLPPVDLHLRVPHVPGAVVLHPAVRGRLGCPPTGTAWWIRREGSASRSRGLKDLHTVGDISIITPTPSDPRGLLPGRLRLCRRRRRLYRRCGCCCLLLLPPLLLPLPLQLLLLMTVDTDSTSDIEATSGQNQSDAWKCDSVAY
jgi:hypothetical protein